MKEVAVYCQHLLGIGHLSRCLNISEELVKYFKTTFIQGGRDVNKTLNHPNFCHIYLPVIEMRESDSQLIASNGPIEDCWEERKAVLIESFQTPIDALIVELYPFGRKKFKDEITFLIKLVKSYNPKVRIICSLRDILVEKNDQLKREKKIVNILNDKFDNILVHSEESFIPLGKTFSLAHEIDQMISYTGFIAENKKIKKVKRKKQVLVSTGGGVVGDELVRAVIQSAKDIPYLNFVFIKSPKMSNEIISVLSQLKFKNTSVLNFSDRYEELLAESSLSISLAGYNTLMNLLRTKTYGLVWPYEKSTEQKYRGEVLEKENFIKILTRKNFQDHEMTELIKSSLNLSDWNYPSPNINGSKETALWLKSELN